jgi:hypothetical protein
MIGKTIVAGWRLICGRKDDGGEDYEQKGAHPAL